MPIPCYIDRFFQRNLLHNVLTSDKMCSICVVNFVAQKEVNVAWDSLGRDELLTRAAAIAEGERIQVSPVTSQTRSPISAKTCFVQKKFHCGEAFMYLRYKVLDRFLWFCRCVMQIRETIFTKEECIRRHEKAISRNVFIRQIRNFNSPPTSSTYCSLLLSIKLKVLWGRWLSKTTNGQIRCIR